MASASASAATGKSSLFAPLDTFVQKHVGPDAGEQQKMLQTIGYESLDAFVDASVPPSIRLPASTVDDAVIPSLGESELLKRARTLAQANKPFKSYIGMGYHNAVVPPVILRNVRLALLLSRVGVCRSDVFVDY